MSTWMTGMMIVLTLLITAVEIVCLQRNRITMAGFVLLLGPSLLIHATALPKGMSLKSHGGPDPASRAVHGEPQGSMGRLLKGRNFRQLILGIVEKQASVTQRERLIGH